MGCMSGDVGNVVKNRRGDEGVWVMRVYVNNGMAIGIDY